MAAGSLRWWVQGSLEERPKRKMGRAPSPLVKVSESSRRAVGALSGFKEGRDRTMFAFGEITLGGWQGMVCGKSGCWG